MILSKFQRFKEFKSVLFFKRLSKYVLHYKISQLIIQHANLKIRGGLKCWLLELKKLPVGEIVMRGFIAGRNAIFFHMNKSVSNGQ